MPTISRFYGIRICMYWDENHHSLPHFHAEYGDHEASFNLAGELIVGYLPQRQLRLVQAWAELHGAELNADWELATKEEALVPIAPLR